MGIKNFSHLIKKGSDFTSVTLHDQFLVIDGNCISCWLYRKYCDHPVFNGDYSKFEQIVKYFFSVLKQCNIFPVVILDGAHEKRKLKHSQKKMRQRICSNFAIFTISSDDMGYPALITEVFKDTLTDLDIFFCQSVLEADIDILKAAQFLDCPVLSYDSDFYLNDVDYIPFLKLNLDVQQSHEANSRPFITGKVFNRDKFFNKINLHNKSFLPLLSFLLGNDYSETEDLENVFLNLTATKNWHQLKLQDQILKLCAWMGKFQTPELAVNDLLQHIPSESTRESAKKEILRCLNESNSSQPSYLINYLHNSLSSRTLPVPLKPLEGSSEWMRKATAYVDSNFLFGPKISIPEWIIEEHIQGKLPRTVMDLFFSQNFYTSLQIEQHSLPSVSSRTIEKLKHIVNIIYYDMPAENIPITTLFIRKNNHLKKEFMKPAPMLYNQSDAFAWLPLDGLKCRAEVITFYVLNIKEAQVHSIIPDAWIMFFLTLADWYQADTSKIATFALGCLVFSSIFIGVIDKKFGYYEDEHTFLKKYSKELDRITRERSLQQGNSKLVKTEDNFSTQNFKSLLSNVDSDDCLLALQEFMSFRRSYYSMSVSSGNLCKEILHHFAQFQTNVIVNEILNSILHFPFQSLKIADFYCGTLAYNIYFEMKSCQNLQSFIDRKFNGIPTLKRLFLSAIKLVEDLSKCTILPERELQVSEDDHNQGIKRRQDASNKNVGGAKKRKTIS